MKKPPPWLFAITGWTLAAIWLATAVPADAADRVNVLLITVDNLGYGDVGCYGNREILTPRIDRLASQGVRCTDFYTGAPSCTPSRASLLTGRYPLRNGLNHQLRTEENLGAGLRLREKILPEYLAPDGYATACFGKWNLGFAEGYRPTERGFHEYFGHASGNCDYYTHRYNDRNDLFRGTQSVQVEGYATDLWANAAIDFITRSQAAEKPFFVYLPLNAPHYPNPRNKRPGEPCIWQAPAEAFAAYGLAADEPDEKKRYRAVVTALDTAIGRVLDALDSLELANNTLVIWYSDNGAFLLPSRGLEVASNGPLRSGGVTVFEGGIRVPAIFRWPDVLPAGGVCREPLIAMDLLPLILQASGSSPLDDRTLDGVNPLRTLLGESPSPHEDLFWIWEQGKSRGGVGIAVRSGDWKLIRPVESGPWELYNLRADVGESQNLASQQPARVAVLRQKVEAWLESVKKR